MTALSALSSHVQERDTSPENQGAGESWPIASTTTMGHTCGQKTMGRGQRENLGSSLILVLRSEFKTNGRRTITYKMALEKKKGGAPTWNVSPKLFTQLGIDSLVT